MIIVYLIMSILVGVLGSNRKIGFFWAFFWSILLSPFIGLVITLISSKKKP